MTSGPIYRDASSPVDARVDDLLQRMTAAEKVAQLGSVWAFEILGPDGLIADVARKHLSLGIGQITRLAGSTQLSLKATALAHDNIQRYLIEQTRLGIPAIVHEETLHGVMAQDAPCFQQSIGAAATWDVGLVESIATTIRRRMLLSGARHALAPVLDIARDPRWGRIEETYGEDPYLAASIGAAYVRGLENGDPANGVMATGKHFVGHGLADGGLNQGPVHLGRREMRDEQLFAFEAAVQTAGLSSVMPAYCEVDGLPAHASRELLTGILRDEWKFDGIVASDYRGISMLMTQHLMTGDLGTAAAMALQAGVDLELPTSTAYAEPLLEAITGGSLDLAYLDASVRRVLQAKFKLGLFERPYVGLPDAATLSALEADEDRFGRELSRRSLVLVENNGILPLSPDTRRIAVIGPIAASHRDLLGDYSHPAHVDSLREMRHLGNTFGVTSVSEGVSAPSTSDRHILDALRQRFSEAHVAYARGAEINGGTDEAIREAVSIAGAAEVAIIVLGERSGLALDATTGESRDRLDLGFIGRQQQLLEAVVATGTPVVLVVVSGRPLAIEWAARHCAAIVLAWVPGDAGPDAIAEVLAGDVDPEGRLPISIPRHVGQVPITYRHHPSGGRSHWREDYVDGPTSPLWAFGFGHSYTTWELSDLWLDRTEIATDGGEVEVSVDITNTGPRSGGEVVQMYVRDDEAEVARPILELRGFARIEAAPGERRTVAFRLSAEQFAYCGADYQRIVEPGLVSVFVGTSSVDLVRAPALRLIGRRVEMPIRHRFFTEVAVNLRVNESTTDRSKVTEVIGVLD